MPRATFVLKIQRELCYPKYARKVPRLLRNGNYPGLVRWWCSDVTWCDNPYGAGCYYALFIFLKSNRTGSVLQYNVISDDWEKEKGRRLYFYGRVTEGSGHDWCKTWWVSCCLFNNYSSSPNGLQPTDVPSGCAQPTCINWLKSDNFESFIWWFSGSNQWERFVHFPHDSTSWIKLQSSNETTHYNMSRMG